MWLVLAGVVAGVFGLATITLQAIVARGGAVTRSRAEVLADTDLWKALPDGFDGKDRLQSRIEDRLKAYLDQGEPGASADWDWLLDEDGYRPLSTTRRRLGRAGIGLVFVGILILSGSLGRAGPDSGLTDSPVGAAGFGVYLFGFGLFVFANAPFLRWMAKASVRRLRQKPRTPI